MMDKQSEELKPLVWVNATDDGQVQDAAGLNAGYRVWLSSSGITRWQMKYMGEWFVAASFDLAKAAAQADYAARIRAALNVSPVTMAEAAQCCMCGKKGLSTIEGDGGPECQLDDGRWTCSHECWDKAAEPACPPTVAEAARVLLAEWDDGAEGRKVPAVDWQAVYRAMQDCEPWDVAAALINGLQVIAEGTK